MKTKAEIFTEAHKIARTLEGNYAACLAEALKISWANAKKANETKLVKYLKIAFKDKRNQDTAKINGFIWNPSLKLWEHKGEGVLMTKNYSLFNLAVN